MKLFNACAMFLNVGQTCRKSAVDGNPRLLSTSQRDYCFPWVESSIWSSFQATGPGFDAVWRGREWFSPVHGLKLVLKGGGRWEMNFGGPLNGCTCRTCARREQWTRANHAHTHVPRKGIKGKLLWAFIDKIYCLSNNWLKNESMELRVICREKIRIKQ